VREKNHNLKKILQEFKWNSWYKDKSCANDCIWAHACRRWYT